jgi:hypothetical protein
MPSGQHVTPGTRLGGRKKGSLDLAERKLLTNRMASDLMTVYEKLGGVKWLLQFAKDNPGEFLRQGLSRLFPAPQKDDPDAVINQINIGNLSDIEAASRIAFALAKAGRQLDAPIDAEPLVPDPEHVVQTPVPAAATPVPDSAPDPAARDSAWQAMVPPSAVEQDDQAAPQATQRALDDHHGTPEEQARPKAPRPGLPRSRSDLL